MTFLKKYYIMISVNKFTYYFYGGLTEMAVPKSKTSKARKRSRAANWKITAPAIVECPRCHEPKLAHRVCKKCGYYDGEQIVSKKEEK